MLQASATADTMRQATAMAESVLQASAVPCIMRQAVIGAPSEPACTTTAPSKVRFSKTKSKNKTQKYDEHNKWIPCAQGSLRHLLSCGHKISTAQFMPCADNCDYMIPDFKCRRNGETFICLACLASAAERKGLSYPAELKAITTGTVGSAKIGQILDQCHTPTTKIMGLVYSCFGVWLFGGTESEADLAEIVGSIEYDGSE